MQGTAQDRLLSLDAFRGFTIAAMVLVNNPGDWSHLYAPLAHAKWHGWTVTDWIFPFFLFIGGVSMTLSLGRRADAGADRGRLLLQLYKRAAIIFLIGFLLNLVPRFDFGAVRIPGVLQRIALCTMAAAPIVVYCGWRLQCAAIGLLFALYSALQLLVPVPGPDGAIAAGLLEPGRDFGAWLDRQLLDGHLWAQSKTWDPEGIVSTLPAVASQLAGVLCGRWLAQALPLAARCGGMLAAGVLLVLAGLAMDALFMPINKSLWTPSYAVFTTGWALLLFAAFLWALDGLRAGAPRDALRRLATPLVIYGMNALFIFALSGLIAKMLGFIRLDQADGAQMSLKALLYLPFRSLAVAPETASLLFAIVFNLFMFAVAWMLWRRRWFIKV